jgi:exosortase K
MKHKFTWDRVALWVVVLLCALALKLCYSRASANQLRWILAPTAALVEVVSGTSFEFESHAGYMSSDRSFLIAPSCAGVNFLITAFLMLSVRKLLRDRSQDNAWGFIPAAALIAYLVTLVANTVRIAIALRLGRLPEIGGLSPYQLHRVEGILVYFSFLLLLFVASEKMCEGKTPGLLRQSFFPLLVYYATTLGLPLANGGYRQGFGFWEHSVFVLLVPLLLILPFAVLGGLLKADTYSCRRATIGSTFAARRAGSQLANTVTSSSNKDTPMNADGSVAVTPYSKLETNRVTATAAINPSAKPRTVSLTPWPMTRESTSRLCAPRATRTPISRVRWMTENDSTP